MALDRSTFTSAAPGSAWWGIRKGADLVVCRTDGATFVRGLQTYLRANVRSGRAYDGVTVSGNSVAIDGKWGPMTTRALWLALKQKSASSLLYNAVAYDGNRRQVTRNSLIAAIWLGHQSGTQGDAPSRPTIVDLHVPTDVVPPTWVVASPGGAGTITCTTESVAASSAATMPSTSISLPADTTPADRVETPPPAVGDTGAPAPRIEPDVPLPTGLPVVFGGGGSSVSWGIVGFAAAAIGAVWLLTRGLVDAPAPRSGGGGRRVRSR